MIAMAAAATALPLAGLAQSDRWDQVAAAARQYDQLNAIVIAQNGTVVLGEAFRGPGLDRPVNVKSVSKTIVAALTGIAIDRGEIADVDATLGEIAPDLIPAGADARVRQITVEHLVTMQAGLERTSGANYGPWVSSGNWVANALARPFISDPGSRMHYSTGSFHILGAALARVSGQSLLALARDRLGGPLGIEIPAWTRDPQGFYLGGNEMALSPMGMVAFGEVYRNGGTRDGRRIMSADWINRSLSPRTRSPFSGLDYGYGWFLGRSGRQPFALARGYGGQIICIVPELELSIAITSDSTRPARSGGYFGDLMDLVARTIIPAAQA